MNKILRNSIVETTSEIKANYAWQPPIPAGTKCRVFRKHRNGDLRVGALDKSMLHADYFLVNINNVKLTDDESFSTKGKVAVGDIFRSRWGYDQTNIDFYVITKVTAKSVSARPIGATKTYNKNCGMSGTIMPDLNAIGEIEKTYRLNFTDDSVFFKPMSFATAWKWSGEPEYFSEYH